MRRFVCDPSPLSSASLNAKITGYLRDGRLPDAEKLFLENPHQQNTTTWNSMMAGYIRVGLVEHAEKMFGEMPHPRDAVSWNTMLAGFRRTGDAEQVYRHFLQMGRSGLRPTEFTLTTLIAAAAPHHVLLIPQLHSHAIRTAFILNTFVGTALIGGYADLEDPISLRRAFDEMLIKNAVSWTELVNGYMELGSVAEARQAFEMMPEKNVVAWTTMINGYINNDNLREARRCFQSMPVKNVVSWTSMIKGYERRGQFVDALELFLMMQKRSEVVPNQYTYSAALSACAKSSSLLIGKLIHQSILKSSCSSRMDVILLTSLVEMYGKCGKVNAAIHVFESIKRKNLVSWNSIIGCCAIHGLHSRAAEEFSRMKESGIRPDHITFVCLLTACVHEGLVEEGERYFKSMEREYDIRARMEHYTCMVDLFGRAGQLERAESLIEEMPFKPDIRVWAALLGACRLHSSLKHGLFAAKAMSELEQDHHAIYSTLLRVYGDSSAWSKVDELKERRETVGARKQKGISWIESTFQ